MSKRLNLIILLALLLIFLAFFRPIQLYGDTAYAIVVGKSMEPTIPKGALVIAKPASEYKRGDIVAFKTPHSDTVLVHRIHEVVDDPTEGVGLITKGDAAPSPDGWTIRPSMVLGKALVSIPYLGYTAIFLRSPLGAVLVLTISFFVLFPLEELIGWLRDRKMRNGVQK